MKTKIILFAFFILSVIAPQSAGAQSLTANERVLRQSILYETGANYLENAYYGGGKILRWNRAYFPIKVYLDNSVNAPAYYIHAFVRAVLIWQNALEDVLSLKFVNSEEEANIVFKVVDDKKYIKKPKENESVTLAYTQPVIKNGKLLKEIIYVYDKNRFGQYYKPHEVLNISVHEMGHALGIAGHSEDKTSIMYALYSPDNEKKYAFISKADINTITLLYKVTPDITNGDKTLERGNIRAEIILGSADERTDASISHALDEIKIKPNDCMSRIKLAVLYEEKKDYNSMYKYAKEAEALIRTKNEEYSVDVLFAYYYYAKKDKQNAKLYVKKALEINDNKQLRELDYFINKL